jgi:hypothetical protein
MTLATTRPCGLDGLLRRGVGEGHPELFFGPVFLHGAEGSMAPIIFMSGRGVDGEGAAPAVRVEEVAG